MGMEEAFMTKFKIQNFLLFHFFLILFVWSNSVSAVIVSPKSNLTINQGVGVYFSGKSSNSKVLKISCKWNFGVNSGIANSSLCTTGKKIFNKPGIHKVVLNVVDVSGVVKTEVSTVTITVKAVANRAPNGVIVYPSSSNLSINRGQSLSFKGSGTDPDGHSYTCLWTFGSGSGIANSTSCDAGAKKFNKAGTFTVVFKVTDAKGLSDPTPATMTVVVNENRAPNGVISSPSSNVTINKGASVTFNGSGVDPDGDSVSCVWNFGSGSGIANSTSCNAGSKVFATAGVFTVSLTVKDVHGLSDSTPAKVVITVKETTQRLHQPAM
jgi:hypothetical protein